MKNANDRPLEPIRCVWVSRLILFAGCWFSIIAAGAAPRPITPPWPELGLIHREGFDQPLQFSANQRIDPQVWTESWSGYALQRSGQRVTPWVVPMVESNVFLVEPQQGAIRFWYRPDYASGTGSGTVAALLELATSNGKASEVWWSLVFVPDKSSIHLLCQTETGLESCLATEVDWPTERWHLITLAFSSTNSSLFLDDRLAAVGAGLLTIPAAAAPYTTLTVGSAYSGVATAQGQIEELSIFSGRKMIQQIRGQTFGLNEAWEIMAYYDALSKTAALGPITEAEISARQTAIAERQAVRAALGLAEESGSPQLMRLVGATSECVTNSPLYITNTLAWFDSNALWTVQFEVQGTNSPVDIFSTTNLANTNAWVWLERGPTCAAYQYTNQAAAMTFYILGDATVDSDGDGMPDAYEHLITHTDPHAWNFIDSDGDGLSDAWEVQHGTDPFAMDPAILFIAEPKATSNLP